MRVLEIFKSISGEVGNIPQGQVVTFLRLAGCNLKCSYCDTPESWGMEAGKSKTLTTVVQTISENTLPVVITGGEPLLQQDLIAGILRNHFKGTQFQIETNGTLRWVHHRPKNLSFVVDYKLDYEDQMDFRFFNDLLEKDWVKIVIKDEEQYKRAKIVHKFMKTMSPAKISFAPVHNKFDLAGRVIEDGLDIVVNCQIHKFLNLK